MILRRTNALLVFILLYYLGVFLDIGTTYLGSPDLKRELNVLVLYFEAGFKEIIIACTLYLIAITIILLKLKEYILKSGENKFAINLFYLIFFCNSCHLVNSYLVSVNNFLGFCYYRSESEFLHQIGSTYAKFVTSIPYYYYYQFFLSCALAAIVCFVLLRFKKEMGR
ncbi:hypothetical protein DF185_20080 [Marinifilum breve]|uniref:Uncharacterized protein n=1 Tax=Marinifilum breve TaxID=2184082 RepID=A0A2V4A6B6_9BACT|nr:hypothetical protein DF185_20080 [Marinifilum breve]